MAFPAAPYTDGQTHTEAGVNYTYNSTVGAWLKASGGAAPGNVPTSRLVSGANSISGGGDLTADRTLSLVGDSASPGTFKYYGTDGTSTKGWHTVSPPPSSRIIATANSVTGGGNLTADRTIQLVGDSAVPGDNMVYGTNASGVRGWQPAVTTAPATRQITGANSISGGGDLTADRVLSLVNDSATPGAFKMYGTNSAGVRGWYDAPKPAVWCSGITMVAPQTVTPSQYYQWNMTNTGIVSTTDATNGTQIPLAAGTTYSIDVSVINQAAAPIKLKIVDRTNNATLLTFISNVNFIYTATSAISISVQTNDTITVANPSGAISVIGV